MGDEKKIYIHWNGLIKRNTVKYKYFCRIDRAKEYVIKVNNWWNVDRVEQKERMYNNRSIMLKNIKQRYEQKEEEIVIEKTEEEIYDNDEKELEKLIKNLK